MPGGGGLLLLVLQTLLMDMEGPRVETGAQATQRYTEGITRQGLHACKFTSEHPGIFKQLDITE